MTILKSFHFSSSETPDNIPPPYLPSSLEEEVSELTHNPEAAAGSPQFCSRPGRVGGRATPEPGSAGGEAHGAPRHRGDAQRESPGALPLPEAAAAPAAAPRARREGKRRGRCPRRARGSAASAGAIPVPLQLNEHRPRRAWLAAQLPCKPPRREENLQYRDRPSRAFVHLNDERQ